MATRKQYLNRLRRWTKKNPGTHQRTLMYKRCGKKCFLGTRKSFPICNYNCTYNKGGIQSAYIRAREMQRLVKKGALKKHTHKYYGSIANRAKRMLYPNN